MSEIGPRFALIEDHRREAALLGRNPYVKEVLRESQFILQKAFGFTPNQFDLANQVNFISFEDRTTIGVRNAVETNLLIHEFKERGIRPKERFLPNIPSYLVDKKNTSEPATISLGSNHFSPYFLDGTSMSSESKNPSVGAIVLFVHLTEAVMHGLTVPVSLSTDEVTLKNLGRRALRGIPGDVENPFDPKFKAFMEELSEQIESGNKLAIQAEGAHVVLTLNGLALDSFYEEEEVGLGFIINEIPEDNFKRRLANSKVNGKKWFVQPELWNHKYEYRAYRKHELYLNLLGMVESQGVASVRERMIKSEMASVFLFRDGILHERNEVEPELAEIEYRLVDEDKSADPTISEEARELVERFRHLLDQEDQKPEDKFFMEDSDLFDDDIPGIKFERIITKKDRKREV